eukprot:scaffold316777_cov12-Tisochrysis_lutea.AAC.1
MVVLVLDWGGLFSLNFIVARLRIGVAVHGAAFAAVDGCAGGGVWAAGLRLVGIIGADLVIGGAGKAGAGAAGGRGFWS